MRSGFILLLISILFGLPAFALDFGIDRLNEPAIASLLANKNLAVLTHAAGKAKNGEHLIDILDKSFTLKKIFAPEHGLRTSNDDFIKDGLDDKTGLPIISLYKSSSRAPRPQDLAGIDAIVIDLQDVGVRYYTYFSTIAEIMKAASPLNIEIILLDRPNLLGGLIVEGKTLDSKLAGSFIAYHTVPTRHGMTLGELARMIKVESKIKTKLTVIPVAGWKRESLLNDFDREWIPPSPALVNLSQVGLYAMWGTLENFNVSVGRGITNELAFNVVGAPWISKKEANVLADKLNAIKISHVKFRPYSWKVTRAIHEGKKVNGVIIDWDGSDVRTDELTYKVAQTLVKLFAKNINAEKMSPQFYGSIEVVDAIRKGKSWDNFKSIVDLDIKEFKERRLPFLLY